MSRRSIALTGCLGVIVSSGCTGSGSDPDRDHAGGPVTMGPDSMGIERVDNPFADGRGYVNPEWQAKAAAEPGGERVANTPTAVWLDSVAAVQGTAGSASHGAMSLREHLDAAIAQEADYIQFVIYNLPGRDCSGVGSSGEFASTELSRYQTEFIDPIVAVMGEEKYRALRIVNIVEVASLPNLITNLDAGTCAEMQANGGYVDGIAYALSKLGSLPNTYNYLDAAQHTSLGWHEHLAGAAQLFADTASKAGMQHVHGFITNTSGYAALREPFFNTETPVGELHAGDSDWLEWNPYVDELSFAQALREELIALGFDASIGMLIDTSRNGWGGAARPTGPSASTDVNTFVAESRVDRRLHTGNWCNQAGAGLGERPRASPEPGIHAYVWIKPPGESDGPSTPSAQGEGMAFDPMCDPSYAGNEFNANNPSGALPDAPPAGAWFSAQFQELMRNAEPPL